MTSRRKRHGLAALSALASACLVVGIGAPARAIVFGVTDGGVVEAAGCSTAACGLSQTFDDTIGGFASVTGSILIDGGTLDLSITLVDRLELAAMGGADNGVSTIAFENVVYTVSGLSLVQQGSKWLIDGSVPGGATAAVSGDYSQDAGAAQAFAEAAARITGSCEIVGSSVTCGFGFGTAGLDLAVGNQPLDRYFRHTLNVTGIVPEPSTGLLLACGLAGLALRRSR